MSNTIVVKNVKENGKRKKLNCVECGDEQGRKTSSMCWIKFKCCSSCYKLNHRKTRVKKASFRQSCKECGAVRTRYSFSICWKDNLCGLCQRKQNAPRKFNLYTLCKCGEYLTAVTYSKNGIYVNTGLKVCTKCTIMYLPHLKYKFASLLQTNK